MRYVISPHVSVVSCVALTSITAARTFVPALAASVAGIAP
jgi:hypothetical protein